MKHISLFFLGLFAISCLMCSCTEGNRKQDSFDINGAWTLLRMEYPAGQVFNYPNEGMTYLRIFNDDSTYCSCQIMKSPSGIVVIPGDKGTFTMINKGGNDRLYFEEGHPRPLKVVDKTHSRDVGRIVTKYGRKRQMCQLNW